jgi:hypothetical protein
VALVWAVKNEFHAGLASPGQFPPCNTTKIAAAVAFAIRCLALLLPALFYGWNLSMLTFSQIVGAPTALRALTGLTAVEFDTFLADVAGRYAVGEKARLERPQRKRAPGAGRSHALPFADRVLLCILFIRFEVSVQYLAWVFEISELTVWRVRRRLMGLVRDAPHAHLIQRKQGALFRWAKQIVREAPDLAVICTQLRTSMRWRQQHAEKQVVTVSG